MKRLKYFFGAFAIAGILAIGILNHHRISSVRTYSWDSPEFVSVVRSHIATSLLQEIRFADLELAPGVFLYTDIMHREGIHVGILSELGWSPSMLHRLDIQVDTVKSFLRSIGLGDVEVVIRRGTSVPVKNHFINEEQRFDITTIAISFLRTPLGDTRKKL